MTGLTDAFLGSLGYSTLPLEVLLGVFVALWCWPGKHLEEVGRFGLRAAALLEQGVLEPFKRDNPDCA